MKGKKALYDELKKPVNQMKRFADEEFDKYNGNAEKLNRIK